MAENVERWRVLKVLPGKTGRMFVMENPLGGSLLTVCGGILRTDFARVMDRHQPFVGESCETEETQEAKRTWYAD
jgi:hypothetical protein